VGGLKDYYEDLWERLPEALTPPDFERRLAFLTGELRGGERVLDLGCGEGTFTGAIVAAAGPEGSVVGAEVAEAALARARARLPELPDATWRLVELDGELPFADGAFDVVWASEVIEHVADTARWLSEVRRVLAGGGRLLLTTPDHGRLRLALSGIGHYSEPLGDHLHLYDRRSLAALLDDFDFSAIQVRAVGGVPLARRLLLARAVR
jgi:ubiquinone/menaquinone biosynthesis C-methylase UbiE